MSEFVDSVGTAAAALAAKIENLEASVERLEDEMRRCCRTLDVFEPGQTPPQPSEELLTWAPPDTAGYTTLTINADGSKSPATLDPNTDYVVSAPNPITGTVVLDNCRNVVWLGGEFNVSATGRGDSAILALGSYGNHVTGTIHLEGLHFYGSQLNEAIEIASTGADIRVQNCLVENLTYYTDQSNGHPDVIQPNRMEGGTLKVDKVTGYTGYQGMFLRTDVQYYSSGGPVYLKRVNIVASDSTNGDGYGSSGDTALFTSYANAIEPWNIDGLVGGPPWDPGVNDNTTVYTGGPWYVENCYVDNDTSYVIEDWEFIRCVNESNGITWATVNGNEFTFPTLDRMRNFDDTGGAVFYGGRPSLGDFVSSDDVGIGYSSPGYIS